IRSRLPEEDRKNRQELEHEKGDPQQDRAREPHPRPFGGFSALQAGLGTFTEVHDETLHGHEEESEEFRDDTNSGEDNQRQTSRQVTKTLSPCHTEPPLAGSNASTTLWLRKYLSRPTKKAPTDSSWYRKIVRVRFQCAVLQF